MATDELDIPTSGKFTLGANSCVSDTNKVTFAVALPGDTGVAMDSGDLDHTVEVFDDLKEPDNIGMVVDLIELVIHVAGIIFFFALQRTWCVANLFL